MSLYSCFYACLLFCFSGPVTVKVSIYKLNVPCMPRIHLHDFFFRVYCMIMAYTCLIVLDPEIPFTLPEMKGISGIDCGNYKLIK